MNKIIVLIMMCIFVSACGVNPPRDYMLQSKQVEKTVKMVPEWYTDLPVDDDMIYSSGAATAPDLQLAVDIATLNAKAKLADRIDGRLDSMTKSLVSQVGENVDASVITELERVSKNVIAEVDVAGYSRKELDVIASGNQFMAFVLLEYSDREATKVYTNRLKKYKLFSNNLWDELDYETSAIIE
tara:strand:- start:35 stop:589 length:555 start_codon:yes stop_codon:yes gene_type:complete